MNQPSKSWGHLPGGQIVRLFSLESDIVRARISDYGGRLIRLQTPDAQGQWGDTLLGSESLNDYLHHPQARYYGALIGRFGNRIAAGRFELDGKQYQLATNDGPNALHGGPGGFHQVLWQAEHSGNALRLTYRSPDGEEGYPGNLRVEATYTLAGDTLRLSWHAETDAPTILNLTHHPFWNLRGGGSVLEHELTVHASRFSPVDAVAIPTGELAEVTSTPFDFQSAHPIGERLDEASEQLRNAGGYDHNFVLNGEMGDLRPAATLRDPVSGRRLAVTTTEPGLQVYSGNFSDGSFTGYAQRYERRSSVCLEPQHFPDSPNQPQFPSTVLRPGEDFASVTEYTFSAR